MATQPMTRLTEQDYLRLERAADFKSEFIEGEAFPLAGGTLCHAALACKFGGILIARMAAGTIYVFSSDARIRTGASGSYVYPDVSVTIGPPQTHEGSDDVLTNPALIIEVLSPSTADYDHGKKFSLYREIPTFADYLLVHTDEIFVEHYSRQSDGSWVLRDHRSPEAVLSIPSINCTVQLGEIYSGVFEIPE